MLPIDIELLLQKHRLQTVDRHEDEGEHEVVGEASDKVLGVDATVELNLFEAGGFGGFFEKQGRGLHKIYYILELKRSGN